MKSLHLGLMLTLASLSPLCCISASSVTPDSVATAKLYQIEVIIFSHLNATSLASEQWAEPQTAQLTAYTDLNNNLDPEHINLQYIGPSNQFLTPTIKKLKKNHFPIILHLAWQQQFDSSDAKTTIHLYGGRAYADDGSMLDNVMDQTTPSTMYQHWQLNGEVTINVNRYFNVGFNLYFSEPLSTLKLLDNTNYFNSQPGEFYQFHLLQTRRTRSKELNYMDSPLYGILFEIKKITPEQELLIQKDQAETLSDSTQSSVDGPLQP